jgi:hypothetical protein
VIFHLPETSLKVRSESRRRYVLIAQFEQAKAMIVKRSDSRDVITTAYRRQKADNVVGPSGLPQWWIGDNTTGTIVQANRVIRS